MPHRTQAVGSLPPLLVRLIHAANWQDLPDTAAALAAYGQYALVAVPTRGVLPRDAQELDNVVEQIAKRHLGLTEARRAFLRTTEAVKPLERRDAIQTSALEVQIASDQACYCAGLAFGVTLAQLAQYR